MALSAVKNWFGWAMHPPGEAMPPPPVEAMPVIADEPHPVATPPLRWSPERLITTDALWGDGFQFPGGEIETLRLAKPLGLSKASSLLLLGAGAGGPACALATHLGVWVSGFDTDPDLVAAAVERIAHRNLTKHAQSEIWNPREPKFREHFYHHGLALEPLHGSQPERTLSAIAAALKPSGHLMMVELVADTPLNPANPVVAAWAQVERRDPRALPTEVAITRILGRLRFDVRVAEDVSDRCRSQALTGWRSKVRGMENARPTHRQAMLCIQEAELWMLRLRLMQIGSLRLVRWHAIGGG